MKKIPTGLTPEKMKALLILEYGIVDSGGLAILSAGIEAYARAEAAKKQIDADGLMIPCANGSRQKHPLLAVERDSRAQWLQALRQLCLDVIPTQSGPGRPPGR